ncbi:MAG: hypothetical protein ACOYL6_18390 [Bacteriovoracaceae bacterium]
MRNNPLLFAFIFLYCFASFAQTSNIEVSKVDTSLEDELPKDLGSHVKEVFMKGSADGHSVFTVLGLSKGVKLSQKILKRMVHMQELVDIGDRFNNSGHVNDFKDEWDQATEKTRDSAPEILKAPWRSVKKIPYSHQVTIQQARDAYESSGTVAEGVLKYTGLVAWAYVKDSYYLVIETPFQFVKNLAITTLAVPFYMTIQVVEIGLRFTWFTAKATSALIASGGVMAYSVVSSTIGAVVSFIIDAPRFIWRPLQMGEDLNVKPEKLTELGIILEQVLANHVSKEKEIVIESVRKENREKYKVYVINEKKEKELAFVAKLIIKDQSIFLDFEMGKAYFEDLKEKLKEQGVIKADRKDQIKLDMRHLVDIFKSQITPDMVKLDELEGGSIFKRLQIQEVIEVKPDQLVAAGKVLEQVLETSLGENREVKVESILSDKKEHFKVYIGKTDAVLAYDVTLSVKKKNLYLDMEMMRVYYKKLKRKFKIQGVVDGSIEEHVGMELRRLSSEFKLQLRKQLAI